MGILSDSAAVEESKDPSPLAADGVSSVGQGLVRHPGKGASAPGSRITTHESLVIDFLIATFSKLKIQLSPVELPLSQFLTATKTEFPNFGACSGRGNLPGEILLGHQVNPSGEIQFLAHGKDNFSSGFNIVSSEASRDLEVYNPGRFLRRHP